MKRSVGAALLVTGALLVAGCAQPAGSTSGRPGSSGGSGVSGSVSSGSVSAGSGSTGAGTTTATRVTGTGGGAAEPTAGCAPTSDGLLRRMSAGHNADHDRLTLEFCGAQPPTLRISYVPAVTADPSDRPVPLAGSAFLRVAVQPATLDTAPRVGSPAQAQHYTGPQRITPGYALLKEAAMAGDFEGVLSVGIGLAHPAGVTIIRLTGPARIAVDVWSTPPHTFLGPSKTQAEATALQASVDQGHQPWQTDPALVGPAFLGWTAPQVQRLAAGVYQLSSAGKIAILTLFQPVRQGAGGIWEVSQSTVTG